MTLPEAFARDLGTNRPLLTVPGMNRLNQGDACLGLRLPTSGGREWVR
jgi:hypothetical protein